MSQLKVKKESPLAPQEHLENFFALSTDLMCVASLDGYLKAVNPACTRVLGFSKWELMTTPYFELVHPEDRPQVSTEMEKLHEAISTVYFECRFLTKNEGYRWLSWRFAPSEGGLIYGVGHDLTEKKAKEALLAQAREKMISNSKLSALGEMAGGIAHEVNNPLAIILGRSGILLNLLKQAKDIDRSKLVELATSIETTAHRIAQIIQGLRHFSRDGSNDELQSTKLADIVTDTLSFCAQRFKAKDVNLKVSEFNSELMILCRPVQISQVILNLLNNAFHAVSERDEKWIQLEILDRDDHIEIAIIDSGDGIPEDIREKIFQPFFTNKPVGSGTGLGLSISKGIIESHNGKLEIDLASKNTRFVIMLPKKKN